MSAMFEATLRDADGKQYIYGHCFYDDDDGSAYGCGMEYAYRPEEQVLERWHDAVGLVTTTTGFTVDQWDQLGRDHDEHLTEKRA